MTVRRAAQYAFLIVVLLVLAAAGVYVLGSEPTWRHVSADFTTVDGLYGGADVKILGVPVGEVTGIHSHGTYVRVDMRYDAAHPLAVDADAVIVQPSIVGDRFVQFTPAWQSGPQLADNAHLGTGRTQTPVTLDQTYASLDKLAAALAPNSSNSKGALADALHVAAANLKGNGSLAHSTVGDLSKALGTLADNSGSITGTVDNLASLTKALAADDPQVRALATNLALVSQQLDSQRGDLTSALTALQPALTQVADFVRSNRAHLVGSVGKLATAAKAVASQHSALDEVLKIAPLAVTNLDNAYEPQNWDPADPTKPLNQRLGALQARANFFNDLSVQLAEVLQGVCGALPTAAQVGLKPLCSLLTSAGNAVGTVLQTLLGAVMSGGGTLLPASSPSSLGDLMIGGTS